MACGLNRLILAMAFLAVAFASFASTTLADEAVDAISTQIVINRAGTADVKHRIVVRAEGDEIKRGIYFEIPDSIGPVKTVSVRRDGATEIWRLRRRTLRIGDRDVRLEPGTYVYEITYQAPTPFLRGPKDTLDLTWAPIALQFELPVTQTDVTVTWPDGIEPLGSDRDTSGPQQTLRLNWINEGDDGPPEIVLRWASGAFPDEVVRVPSRNTSLRIGGPVLAILVLIICQLTWRAVGRDRRPGLIFPTLDPPDRLSPSAVRYIRNMGYDTRVLVAGMASLVCKGAIRIETAEKKALQIHSKTGARRLDRDETALLNTLMDGETDMELKGSSKRLRAARRAHRDALQADHRGTAWTDNRSARTRLILLGLAIGGVLIALVVQERQIHDWDRLSGGIGIFSALIAIAIPLLYFSALSAPTAAGRRLMDRIAGLQASLMDETPLPDREATADHFFALLPYAVALDQEDAWRARFASQLTAPAVEADAGDVDIGALLDWYERFRKTSDDATLAAALLPVLAGSSASGGTSGGSSGAAAGGW